MIQTTQLGYRVGNRWIVAPTDAVFPPGQVHALVGPNGAGKSTFLKLLCQQLKPGSGRVAYGGVVANAHALARQRGVLNQQAGMAFPLRVWETVLLGRYPHGAGFGVPAGAWALVQELMTELEVAHLADRLMPTLSGGEQQRVHLARVLAQVADLPADMPRYLLLDEPLTHLDLKHQLDLLALVRRYTDSRTVTLLVLHELHLLRRYVDAVHVFHQGQYVRQGAPHEVLPWALPAVFGVEAEVLGG